MATIKHLVMEKDHMEGLYSSRNPLVRFVHNQRLRAVAQALPSGNGLSVLDADCGEGQLIALMHSLHPSYSFTGIDATDAAVRQARQRCLFADIAVGDIAKTAYADASFDVITCTEVIEHVPEYNEVFLEFRRLLRPGGRLIITFPNETLWTAARVLLLRRPFRVADHVNSFTPKRIASASGLRLLKKVFLPFGGFFWTALTVMMVFLKPEKQAQGRQ